MVSTACFLLLKRGKTNFHKKNNNIHTKNCRLMIQILPPTPIFSHLFFFPFPLISFFFSLPLFFSSFDFFLSIFLPSFFPSICTTSIFFLSFSFYLIFFYHFIFSFNPFLNLLFSFLPSHFPSVYIFPSIFFPSIFFPIFQSLFPLILFSSSPFFLPSFPL